MLAHSKTQRKVETQEYLTGRDRIEAGVVLDRWWDSSSDGAEVNEKRQPQQLEKRDAEAQMDAGRYVERCVFWSDKLDRCGVWLRKRVDGIWVSTGRMAGNHNRDPTVVVEKRVM